MARLTPAQIERDVAAALASDGPVRVAPERAPYPRDLVPGDVVHRVDARGRKRFEVTHLSPPGRPLVVYAREVGRPEGRVVAFSRAQVGRDCGAYR